MRGGVRAVVIAAVGLSSRDALAADFPLTLSWQAPAGCPSGAQVQAQVRKLAGAIRPGTPEVSATVEVTSPRAGRFEVRIATRRAGEQGERTFEGSSCRQVTNASALILSMLLEPVQTADTVLTPEGNPAAPPSPPETPASGTPGVSTPTREEPEGGAPLHLLAGALAVLDDRTLPGVAPGLGVGVALERGRLWVEARGTAFLPRRGGNGPRAGTGVEAGLWTGALQGCWTVWPGRYALAGCLTAEGGRATAEGIGLTRPQEASGAWLAGLVGVRLVPAASSMRAWLGLDVGAPLVRPRFVIEGFGEAHRAAAPLLRLSLGVYLPLFLPDHGRNHRPLAIHASRQRERAEGAGVMGMNWRGGWMVLVCGALVACGGSEESVGNDDGLSGLKAGSGGKSGKGGSSGNSTAEGGSAGSLLGLGGSSSVEACNDGLDNDNDGSVDEDCSCNEGAQQKCFVGPIPAAGKGACSWGTQTCVKASGSGETQKTGWGPCQGYKSPSAEVCDGLDNDCNGKIDDACTASGGGGSAGTAGTGGVSGSSGMGTSNNTGVSGMGGAGGAGGASVGGAGGTGVVSCRTGEWNDSGTCRPLAFMSIDGCPSKYTETAHWELGQDPISDPALVEGEDESGFSKTKTRMSFCSRDTSQVTAIIRSDDCAGQEYACPAGLSLSGQVHFGHYGYCNGTLPKPSSPAYGPPSADTWSGWVGICVKPGVGVRGEVYSDDCSGLVQEPPVEGTSYSPPLNICPWVFRGLAHSSPIQWDTCKLGDAKTLISSSGYQTPSGWLGVCIDSDSTP